MNEKPKRPQKDEGKNYKDHGWMSNLLFHARLIFSRNKPSRLGK